MGPSLEIPDQNTDGVLHLKKVALLATRDSIRVSEDPTTYVGAAKNTARLRRLLDTSDRLWYCWLPQTREKREEEGRDDSAHSAEQEGRPRANGVP